MSKGSTSRPFSVSNQEYSNRWDAIFGRDNDTQKNKEKAMEPTGSNSTRSGGSSDNTKTDLGQAQIR